MIAIFVKSHGDFHRSGCRFSPRSKFKIITNENCILGCTFEGVICIGQWWENKDVHKAYEELNKRQPEIYKL